MTPHELMLATPKWPKHVCLTGGEPFVQKRSELQDYCERLYRTGYTIECFSNGSVFYPQWTDLYGITFMMDWKLQGSGEADSFRDVRERNAIDRLGSNDGIKFVVTGNDDLFEAQEVWKYFTRKSCRAQFYVAAAWGLMTDAEIVEFIKGWQLPWKLNVQVHKYVYEPSMRGV
jgi:7-carboxy-7-deazaguanine synthase